MYEILEEQEKKRNSNEITGITSLLVKRSPVIAGITALKILHFAFRQIKVSVLSFREILKLIIS